MSASSSLGWLAGAALDGLGRSGPAERVRRAMAARVAGELGRLKGLAMKIGQILSFAIDDVPVELREALQALQTSSPPRPLSQLAPVIERALGLPLRRAFASIDAAPIAAASIGQVHRAVLHDGTAVAVKIQYPDVAAAVRADVANLSALIGLLRLLAPHVDAERVALELRLRILEELDYQAEARSQAAFGARFQDHPFISIPRVIASHSAAEVLTSGYVEGRRFPEQVGADEEARSRQGEVVFRFLHGCLYDWGTLDADPHPGNYLFDRDGTRVTFLDFGCVKELPAPLRLQLRGFARARLEGDLGEARARVQQLGFVAEGAAEHADRIVEVLSRVYLPFGRDQRQRFPSLWEGVSLAALVGRESVRLQVRLPGDLVFVNRTVAGLFQVLSRLGATANWGRIAREYLCDEPPSTALGVAERAWKDRRLPAQPTDR